MKKTFFIVAGLVAFLSFGLGRFLFGAPDARRAWEATAPRLEGNPAAPAPTKSVRVPNVRQAPLDFVGLRQPQPTLVEAMPTVSPTSTAIPLPAPTGEPRPLGTRVQFARGSYGATITGQGANRYLLWAKQGQVFTTAMVGRGFTSLVSPDGRPLYETAWAESPVTTTLTTAGDQLLEVRANGQYTVGVEIR